MYILSIYPYHQMRSSHLLVAVLCLSWLVAAEGIIVLAGAAAVGAAALAIGGLAALKGAAIVGYAAGRHHRRYHGRSYGHYRQPRYKYHRYGRSVDPAADEGEDLLLATVGQLDPNGCILKMLCQLQTKDESTLTLEEDLLLGMFANSTETLSSFNAAFVYATDIGSKTRDPSVCKKFFPKCPLGDKELDGLLQMAWGCGAAFLEQPEEGQRGAA